MIMLIVVSSFHTHASSLITLQTLAGADISSIGGSGNSHVVISHAASLSNLCSSAHFWRGVNGINGINSLCTCSESIYRSQIGLPINLSNQ